MLWLPWLQWTQWIQWFKCPYRVVCICTGFIKYYVHQVLYTRYTGTRVTFCFFYKKKSFKITIYINYYYHYCDTWQLQYTISCSLLLCTFESHTQHPCKFCHWYFFFIDRHAWLINVCSPCMSISLTMSRNCLWQLPTLTT